METVRVLVVDDAVTARRLVAQALAADPALEVVGVAANGRIALSRIAQLSPDVVTLDIEMPDMDGLATLDAIRRDYPGLPVIMLSSFTQRGAARTLDALARGACDYVPKPTAARSAADAIAYLGEQLIPRIKAVTGTGLAPQLRAQPSPESASAPAPPLPRGKPERYRHRIDVVGIGVSTGGPNALAKVLADLPHGLPVPVLIVQHMPPMFTAMLAERLHASCQLDVREASNGEVIQAGGVWLAPGDFHMVAEKTGPAATIGLHQLPAVNSCRPSVDVLFRSLAAVWGSHVLALVMTGMGRDGLEGAEAVAAAGGQVLAQDQATSVVWGMPGLVTQRGLADATLPLGELGAELVQRVSAWRCAPGQLPRQTPTGEAE